MILTMELLAGKRINMKTINKTINGVYIDDVTKKDALKFCYDNKDAYIRGYGSIEEGIKQFDCLICILKDGEIDPKDLPNYGMSDQDLQPLDSKIHICPICRKIITKMKDLLDHWDCFENAGE